MIDTRNLQIAERPVAETVKGNPNASYLRAYGDGEKIEIIFSGDIRSIAHSVTTLLEQITENNPRVSFGALMGMLSDFHEGHVKLGISKEPAPTHQNYIA